MNKRLIALAALVTVGVAVVLTIVSRPDEATTTIRIATATPGGQTHSGSLDGDNDAKATASEAVVEGVARFRDVEVAVEGAVITNMVLTEFFGLPAVDPDLALVIHIRVTNLSITDTVTYITPRAGSNTGLEGNVAVVVDDLDQIYRGINYGKVPEGGVVTARIEPGSAIADVLIFEVPGHDVRYLDLIVPGPSVGVAQALRIRVPWEAVKFVETSPAPDSRAPSVPDEAPKAEPDVSDEVPKAEPDAPPQEENLPVDPTDPAGLYKTGQAYLLGEGISKDEAKGHERLLMAAELGHPAAQTTVGQNFEAGRGTQRNPAEALTWYREAAGQKYPEGQWNLGRAYREGIGVSPNPRTALRWFLKAATQHHTQALWDATEMLKNGDGVKQNLHEAARWLKELMKQGDREAQIELAKLDPSAYVSVAKALEFQETLLANEPGSAVKVPGRLRDQIGDTWTLVVRRDRTVRVDMSRIANQHVGEGIFVKVCGILGADRIIDVLVCEIPRPKGEAVVRRVLSPGGVVGRQRALYIVECVVTNSGQQPIRLLTASVKVSVKAVSRTESVTVEGLMPGEKRAFRVEVELWNPSVVSAPRGDIKVTRIEW